ncbi:hypothetical protein NKG05_02090 [Oerskovia sp. M15]
MLLAAQGIRAGDGDLVLAGGVESASTARCAPTAHPTDRPQRRPYDRAPFTPPEYGDPDMGAAADALARELGIGRERQDAYAARSHARALAAHAEGGSTRRSCPWGALAGRAGTEPRPCAARAPPSAFTRAAA